jgi:hypothetical protein
VEIDSYSYFFPVVGLSAALLMMLASSWGADDQFSREWWTEIIGYTFGFGLLIFTPVLWFAGSCFSDSY